MTIKSEQIKIMITMIVAVMESKQTMITMMMNFARKSENENPKNMNKTKTEEHFNEKTHLNTHMKRILQKHTRIVCLNSKHDQEEHKKPFLSSVFI